MNKLQEQFFLACYFADYERLKTFQITESLKQFTFTFIPSSSYYIQTGGPLLFLTAEEVLKMNYDAWFDLREKSELYSDASVNPSLVFGEIVKCLGLLQVDIEHFEVDYYRYYFLQHSIFDDEEWFDERECKEFREKGIRQLDLDLYNAAKKNDKTRIIALVKTGADGSIDPYQEDDYGSLLDSYSMDFSCNFHQMVSYRDDYLEGEAIGNDNFNHMVSILYCCGSAEEMTRVIKKNEIKR